MRFQLQDGASMTKLKQNIGLEETGKIFMPNLKKNLFLLNFKLGSTLGIFQLK